MRIGLLGGTFDPVHTGHVKLGAAALRQLGLSRVYFVLTPISPFKKNRRQTPAAARLQMLKIALSGRPRLSIGRWEINRKGPALTATTIRNYKKRRPRDEVFFIMGSDAFRGFSRWSKPDRIARMAKIVVGRRPGYGKVRIPDRFRRAAVVLRGRFPDISSTDIRRAFKKGRTRHPGISAPVLGFIKKNKLYGASLLS